MAYDKAKQYEEEMNMREAARRRAQDCDDGKPEAPMTGINTTRPRTLGDRLLHTQIDLECRLGNIRRLRGALSRDALDLPASILD